MDVCMQMLVLYVFISCEFSRWRVSPKIATRETSGAKQEASNILKPSLNYLLFRPKHHNFPSSHCLFLGLYRYQLQKALSQPIRRHGKRQSVAALGSLAWCGVLSSHPTVTGRIPWLIDHQGSWWWAFYFVVIEAFLVSLGNANIGLINPPPW